MATWRWINDGDKSGIMFDDGGFYGANSAGISDKERVEINNLLEVASSVWGILYTARAAYATGTADYRDACAVLTLLVAELSKAQQQLEKVLADMSTYFVTSPLSGSLARPLPLAERVTMAKEAVIKLNPKKEIPAAA